ncbi:hypothetical protein BJ508DRAFT_328891 [Ascobolus immersus RN42]|uniref:Uncharacterized protein n=1 Tax=Ascobolus immersus RN42 TaxID=1160509 RepID=A0A3N4I2G9_ASCIM|nr:hypothetical protein BJ508DRAFT_328891 [Ascobolus immersus RN42]
MTDPNTNPLPSDSMNEFLNTDYSAMEWDGEGGLLPNSEIDGWNTVPAATNMMRSSPPPPASASYVNPMATMNFPAFSPTDWALFQQFRQMQMMAASQPHLQQPQQSPMAPQAQASQAVFNPFNFTGLPHPQQHHLSAPSSSPYPTLTNVQNQASEEGADDDEDDDEAPDPFPLIPTVGSAGYELPKRTNGVTFETLQRIVELETARKVYLDNRPKKEAPKYQKGLVASPLELANFSDAERRYWSLGFDARGFASDQEDPRTQELKKTVKGWRTSVDSVYKSTWGGENLKQWGSMQNMPPDIAERYKYIGRTFYQDKLGFPIDVADKELNGALNSKRKNGRAADARREAKKKALHDKKILLEEALLKQKMKASSKTKVVIKPTKKSNGETMDTQTATAPKTAPKAAPKTAPKAAPKTAPKPAANPVSKVASKVASKGASTSTLTPGPVIARPAKDKSSPGQAGKTIMAALGITLQADELKDVSSSPAVPKFPPLTSKPKAPTVPVKPSSTPIIASKPAPITVSESTLPSSVPKPNSTSTTSTPVPAPRALDLLIKSTTANEYLEDQRTKVKPQFSSSYAKFMDFMLKFGYVGGTNDVIEYMTEEALESGHRLWKAILDEDGYNRMILTVGSQPLVCRIFDQAHFFRSPSPPARFTDTPPDIAVQSQYAPQEDTGHPGTHHEQDCNLDDGEALAGHSRLSESDNGSCDETHSGDDTTEDDAMSEEDSLESGLEPCSQREDELEEECEEEPEEQDEEETQGEGEEEQEEEGEEPEPEPELQTLVIEADGRGSPEPSADDRSRTPTPAEETEVTDPVASEESTVTEEVEMEERAQEEEEVEPVATSDEATADAESEVDTTPLSSPSPRQPSRVVSVEIPAPKATARALSQVDTKGSGKLDSPRPTQSRQKAAKKKEVKVKVDNAKENVMVEETGSVSIIYDQLGLENDKVTIFFSHTRTNGSKQLSIDNVDLFFDTTNARTVVRVRTAPKVQGETRKRKAAPKETHNEEVFEETRGKRQKAEKKKTLKAAAEAVKPDNRASLRDMI